MWLMARGAPINNFNGSNDCCEHADQPSRVLLEKNLKKSESIIDTPPQVIVGLWPTRIGSVFHYHALFLLTRNVTKGQ